MFTFEEKPCVVGRTFTGNTEVPAVAAHLDWVSPCGRPGTGRILGDSTEHPICVPHGMALIKMIEVAAGLD